VILRRGLPDGYPPDRKVALLFMVASWIAFAILLFGKRFIPEVKYVEEIGAPLLMH